MALVLMAYIWQINDWNSRNVTVRFDSVTVFARIRGGAKISKLSTFCHQIYVFPKFNSFKQHPCMALCVTNITLCYPCENNYQRHHRTTPWQIGTLKYLEIEIKKWPSGARRGQIGPIGPNGTKRDQARPNGAKWGQTGLNGANGAK